MCIGLSLRSRIRPLGVLKELQEQCAFGLQIIFSFVCLFNFFLHCVSKNHVFAAWATYVAIFLHCIIVKSHFFIHIWCFIVYMLALLICCVCVPVPFASVFLMSSSPRKLCSLSGCELKLSEPILFVGSAADRRSGPALGEDDARFYSSFLQGEMIMQEWNLR